MILRRLLFTVASYLSAVDISDAIAAIDRKAHMMGRSLKSWTSCPPVGCWDTGDGMIVEREDCELCSTAWMLDWSKYLRNQYRKNEVKKQDHTFHFRLRVHVAFHMFFFSDLK